MVMLEYSVGKIFFVFSKLRDTSARLAGLRVFVPLKMIFSIFSERSIRVFCSPNTQRMASTTFDFPLPFGPTMDVTPLSKWMMIFSPKLLNPLISRVVNRMFVLLLGKNRFFQMKDQCC